MITCEQMRETWACTPMLILGGGPSLSSDLEKVGPEWIGHSVVIGVNHHFAAITDADLLAFIDDPECCDGLRDLVESREWAECRMSPSVQWSDIEFEDVPAFGQTGPFATWAAHKMGGDPIVLLGFDLYTTGPFHAGGGLVPDHPALGYSVEKHLDAWRRARADHFPLARVFAASGPLVKVFTEFNPDVGVDR